MPSIYDLMENTRLRLGEPLAQRPSDALVLQQVCSHTRTLLRHKENTSNPWNFNDYIVDVVPNESVYQINAADFGIPLAVFSYAPTLPTWIPRMIPMSLPQDIFYDYAQPPNLAGAWYLPADGSYCTATRCTFYWKLNLPYIEFVPVPQMSAQYKIRYLQSANQVDQMALTQEPVQAQDADLIEIRSAKSLLSNTEWMAGDTPDGRSYNSEKRKELMLTLTNDEALAQRQFEAAQLAPYGGRTHNRWNNVTV